MPDWDAIDTVPLVSWLPDVSSQTYTGVAAGYEKLPDCLDSVPPPCAVASGKT